MTDRRYHALALAATDAGTLIEVKVVPGASRDKVVGPLGQRLKIATSRPPEKGAANKAVCATLARCLDLAPRDVKLAAGPARPEKTLLVRGLDPAEVRRRLEGA